VKKTLSIIFSSSIGGDERVYHEQCAEEEFIFVSPCTRVLKADYSSCRKGKDVTKEKKRQGRVMLRATDFVATYTACKLSFFVLIFLFLLFPHLSTTKTC